MKRLLLVSNSTQYGRGYLDHVDSELRSLIGRARRVLFAPFALFRPGGVRRQRSHPISGDRIRARSSRPRRPARGSRGAVRRRRKYFPTAEDLVKTTKDMPIVQPRSFEA